MEPKQSMKMNAGDEVASPDAQTQEKLRVGVAE